MPGQFDSGTASPLAGAAHLASVLAFQECEQVEYFGSQKFPELENLVSLSQSHPGQKNELVCRPQGGARFAC